MPGHHRGRTWQVLCITGIALHLLLCCRLQDEGKKKELSLALEKLTQQVATQREALDSEVTDTQAAQIQLDRAAQDFRQLHAERQDLIHQWDEAREAMKHRDGAIQVREVRRCKVFTSESWHRAAIVGPKASS